MNREPGSVGILIYQGPGSHTGLAYMPLIHTFRDYCSFDASLCYRTLHHPEKPAYLPKDSEGLPLNPHQERAIHQE